MSQQCSEQYLQLSHTHQRPPAGPHSSLLCMQELQGLQDFNPMGLPVKKKKKNTRYWRNSPAGMVPFSNPGLELRIYTQKEGEKYPGNWLSDCLEHRRSFLPSRPKLAAVLSDDFSEQFDQLLEIILDVILCSPEASQPAFPSPTFTRQGTKWALKTIWPFK